MNDTRKAVVEATGIQDESILSHELDINDEQFTLEEFLYTNLCQEGVDHISIASANLVLSLNVGETCYIGLCTITRIK